MPSSVSERKGYRHEKYEEKKVELQPVLLERFGKEHMGAPKSSREGDIIPGWLASDLARGRHCRMTLP